MNVMDILDFIKKVDMLKLRFLFIIILTSTHSLNAQEVRKKLVSEKILPFTFEHVLRYNIDTGDSADYIHCSFQNTEYTTITDIGSIYCGTQKSCDVVKGELNTIIKFMTENPGTDFALGNFNVYDFAPKSIFYSDGRKNTRFNIVTANKLLLAFENVKLRE